VWLILQCARTPWLLDPRLSDHENAKMSHRGGRQGPSRLGPTPLNTDITLIDQSPTYPSPRYPSPGPLSPRDPRGGYGRYSMPEVHDRPKKLYSYGEPSSGRGGRVGHSSLPSRQTRQQPSQSDIDNLQARIHGMLSDESPRESTTTGASRGRPSRGLYHNPPLHSRQPPKHATHNRNTSSRETLWDSCDDITAYALGIVKSLEMPDDEREEKEQFCRDLEAIVKRIRPSISKIDGD
jgi:hypothetical protein